MKRSLQEIYFDVLDRINLNSKVTQNSKVVNEQLKKDIELKEQIEKVFAAHGDYDVYYHKATLKLHIEVMSADPRDKKNLFNRIEIEY